MNKFYMLDRSFIPEAFPQFYKIDVPDDVRKTEPRGGNKSISGTFRVSPALIVQDHFFQSCICGLDFLELIVSPRAHMKNGSFIPAIE